MTAAAPARFDRDNQRRRSLLGKVHIAKAQLRMIDDDYRAVLLRVVGRASAKDCNEGELVKLVAAFEGLGFDASAGRKPGKPGKPRPASHPTARKARALWLSLHLLGAIDDPSEGALEAFARRQLRVDRLQWADQVKGYKLIEALKAMAERAGWSQSTEGAKPYAVATILKRRLVEALMGKLWQAEVIPLDWSVDRAAWALGGIPDGRPLWTATDEELDKLARLFGRELRKATA